MGRCNYGASIEEDQHGNEKWVPEIRIGFDETDVPDIVFRANLAFDSSDEVETFIHHVFGILSGPKDVQVYQKGTHGGSRLN